MRTFAKTPSGAVGLILGAVSLLIGCGDPLPPPAPTVARAEVIRGGVELLRGSATTRVTGPTRVETGSKLRTQADGRGSVILDSGAFLLFDRASEASVELASLGLESGRVWADASHSDPVVIRTAEVELRVASSSVAISRKDGKTHVYCGSGEITYTSKQGSGRLGPTESARFSASGAPELTPDWLWDDWTGGLADPGRIFVARASSVGQLVGRERAAIGTARTPLPVRAHEVHAEILGDRARTTIVQTFFNARSEELEAVYRLRLPEDALVEAFAIDEGTGFREAAPNVYDADSRYGVQWADGLPEMSSLAYDGPSALRARVARIAPGAVVRVRLVYTEWLERRGGVRTYVHSMASEDAPMLGELTLEVDFKQAEAGAVRAGLGARTTGDKVVLRKSDYTPRADFALDLFDAKPVSPTTAHAYVMQTPRADAPEGDERYVLLDLPPPEDEEGEPAKDEPLDLVILVDVSGDTDAEHLELARSIVDATLRQLTPRDRVTLRLADVAAHAPEGAPAELAPASDAHREALLEGLAHAALGGATDLGRSFRDAASLVAGKPRGVVLYLGDGRPTTGPLDAGQIRAALAGIASMPRFFALALGADANVELLRAVLDDDVDAVDDRVDAARAAMRILAQAARPTLRSLTFDLGTSFERVYPRAPLSAPADENLRLVARLRGELPANVTLHGERDGKKVETTYTLVTTFLDERADVRRRWGRARLLEILDDEAGREAIVDLGLRFGVLTPWTPFVVGSSPRASIPAYRHFDRDPDEFSWASRAAGPGGSSEPSLPGESSGWRRRMAAPAGGLDRGPATVIEQTWQSRTASGDLNAPPIDAPAAGDGGLAVAGVVRALKQGERGPRGCYERKLSTRADLAGNVDLRVEVDGAGTAQSVTVLSSTLGEGDVDACIADEVRGLRFPTMEGSGRVIVTHRFEFAMPTRPIGTRHRCSEASRLSIDERVSLWRETLNQSDVYASIALYQAAARACELPDWRSRRSLVNLVLARANGIVERMRVYHALRSEPAVASYLKRVILRGLRSLDELSYVRGHDGFDLEPPVDWRIFGRMWAAAGNAQARLRLVRRWLEVAPEDMDLRLRLLALLEETRGLTEAKLRARELGADPLADVKVRTAVGEFWLRQGDEAEARRVFSELVERAPLDPWARRKLGDLYRAHGWADDAYREYQTLARLRPDDDGLLLLLARAAAQAGRIDEALRLEQRLAESVDSEAVDGPAASARLWTQVRLARLRAQAATQPNPGAELARIRERERQSGALRDPPALFVALTWEHAEDHPELYVRYPSTPAEVGFERAPVRGSDWGIEAARVREREAGPYVFEARRLERDGLRDITAKLLIISDVGGPAPRVEERELRLTRTTRVARFELLPDGTLVTREAPAPAAVPTTP